MNPSKITLRPLTFQDIDAVIALKKAVLQRQEFNPSLERKLYDWELKQNPGHRDGYPMGFVITHEDNIVGAVVLPPAIFKIGQEDAYGCFEIDLMVSQEFRFYGLMLLNKVWRSEIFPIVVGTTPNQSSYNIETSLGAKEIGFTRYKYVKFIDPFQVGRKQYSSAIIGALIWSLNAGLSFFSKIVSVRPLSGTDKLYAKKVERFDERFDKFCSEASKDYGVIVSRNSKYLNWRYFDFPFGTRAIYAISGEDDQVRGYVVIQHEKTRNGIAVANILEVFTRKDDQVALRNLLDLAVKHAVDNRCDRLEMIPCSAQVARSACLSGFIRRKLSLPACIYKISGSEARQALGRNDNWFISSGDGDTAIYSALSSM